MTPLILITQPGFHLREHEFLRGMFEEGLQRLHVRKPGFSKEQFAEYIDDIPRRFRDKVVVHQFHELKTSLHLGGVHYREADIPEGLIQAPLGSATVSLSYHNPSQLLTCKGSIDYCFLSPIYPSISKKGYVPPPELEDRAALRDYLSGSRSPVVALGGVTPANFEELASLGFAGAALLGAVWNATDPVEACSIALEAASAAEWNDVGGISCSTT